MTVVFDATMLLLMLRPGVGAPVDPATGRRVERAEERIAELVGELERARTRIVVPTPALSELLVRAGNVAPRLIERLTTSATFKIVPFDTLAAIEVAEMTRLAIEAGDKRASSGEVWAKIKYDRQLVAIAKVARAHTIYTDDDNLRNFARAQGLAVVRLADLPLPPERAPAEMTFPDQRMGDSE